MDPVGSSFDGQCDVEFHLFGNISIRQWNVCILRGGNILYHGRSSCHVSIPLPWFMVLRKFVSIDHSLAANRNDTYFVINSEKTPLWDGALMKIIGRFSEWYLRLTLIPTGVGKDKILSFRYISYQWRIQDFPHKRAPILYFSKCFQKKERNTDTVADPEYPKQGANPTRGVNLLFGEISPQNCMKMKKIGRGAGHGPGTALGSANTNIKQKRCPAPPSPSPKWMRHPSNEKSLIRKGVVVIGYNSDVLLFVTPQQTVNIILFLI